jgi:ABC transporter substrate binding protein (PQQ-dependent alcohol dehydrogenase system)
VGHLSKRAFNGERLTVIRIWLLFQTIECSWRNAVLSKKTILAGLVISSALYSVIALASAALAENLSVNILYAEQRVEQPATLSGLHPRPIDLGLIGARLGLSDNQFTGKYIGDTYALEEVFANVGESLAQVLANRSSSLPDVIVVNAPDDELLKIADALKDHLILDIGTRSDDLREENCRANVLHLQPSRSMLADALAQFLLKKKWTNLLLLEGARDNDKLYAQAIRQSAEKFGLTIAAEKSWTLEADMRESAGVEIPLITQGQDYDVVVVADENDDFGIVIPYNTDLPRPVVGTHGLMSTAWSDVIEPLGAAQLQERFEANAKRGMRDLDFVGWLAVKLIGEAATRTKSKDLASVRKFLLSDRFQLAAYKGQGVSFRNWNGQLRQPIHLVTKEAQVAVAPLEGFLHQFNPLDTLGKDRAETKCVAFTKP